MPDPSTASLHSAAHRIRRYALQTGEVQRQGYIGQALGMADIPAVAYRHALNYRPDQPEWEGRDRFLLSHGHYAIALYAALLRPASCRKRSWRPMAATTPLAHVRHGHLQARHGNLRRLAGSCRCSMTCTGATRSMARGRA